MSTKIVPGSLIATQTAEAVAKEATTRISRYLREGVTDRGGATIALSGGSTPKATYELLAKEPIDWTKVQFFFVDERAVPPDHERSNFRLAKSAWLDPAKVPEKNVFRMPADEADAAAAAKRYEDLVRANVRLKKDGLPNIDVVVLGIGDDGHTASLFPKRPEVDVTDRLVVAVPAEGDREARLTMTAPLLEHARASVILAVGKSKHLPLEKVWQVTGTTAETPARIVRSFKGSVTWVIDRAAGGM
ncbi:MAG: 6-phosphogluconolactonase [Myxococcales bacterium]|jgi:6-phosphogluconolactonase|nr:6-phosphogluconolactonase [Myxococcales bacterium]